MKSTALAKAKEENEAIKARNLAKTRREKGKMQHAGALAAGGVGTLAGAAGCAVVDQKFAKDDDEFATFGSSGVPVNAPLGLATAVVGAVLSYKHPALGMFLYNSGLQGPGTLAYASIKKKLQEREED
jgi:hypothetical protein